MSLKASRHAFFQHRRPVKPDLHYCLPPLTRFDLDDVLRLIQQQKYFVLHAPRQTGKTSCLLALMEHLNTSGHYRCVYVNVEIAQAAREDVAGAMQSILNELGSWARIGKPARNCCCKRFCNGLSTAVGGSSGNMVWGGCGRIYW